ncbi:hypothetical protein EI77_03772 [Prosthecobacter fusiformis]|uniref:Parallel beta helix pectate lyase-like protein n=1 Tax=Prosthecobacter fusiformis TaxID=48464 RepID=A0A4R7RMS9_9BACT|nr:right-handed parallel beta-helix repeat-containing protein [Prosthecobacter fusiformis]TDU66035.1 hypothetical protein EI77_03772 [Prosthecobacter fusiformis]
MRFLPLLFCLVITVPLFSREVSSKPLRLSKGGTAEQPFVFDGKGMVIDLGIDITDRAWKKDGDIWTSPGPVTEGELIAEGQHTGLFLDEVPVTLARDPVAERARRAVGKKGYAYHPPSLLKPGQMGCLEDGSLYFRWPASKKPGQASIILPSRKSTSGVTIACSHIIVKNITAMHAGNDGFNIHGSWKGIRLENIRALSNADEGISAHDDVQMQVDGAEIAWNGSSVGGVADVDRSTTLYTNCQVHDNVGAAFKFFGRSHSVTDTLIYNQTTDFTLGKETEFKQDRIERR